MKKLMMIVLMLSAGVLVAQDNKFNVGFEGGVGWVTGSATDDSSGTTMSSEGGLGIYAGLVAEYRFSELFSLRSGLAFEQKKFYDSQSISYSFFGTTYNFSYSSDSRFNYLTIPFNLTVGFGEKVHVMAGAGPYLGFLLSQKTTTTTSGTGIPSETTTENYKEDFKSVDFGLSFIAGVGIPFGDDMEFTILFRDNLGLSNIENDPAIEMTMKMNAMYGLVGVSKKF